MKLGSVRKGAPELGSMKSPTFGLERQGPAQILSSRKLIGFVCIALIALLCKRNSSSASFTLSSSLYKPIFRPDINKVVVVGGAGYVGSYLSTALQSKGLEVTIFDKAPNLAQDFNPELRIVTVHSREVSQLDLSMFGTVIFLGGCTGRKSCEVLSDADLEEENVSNVIDIMKKMSSSQHLVAASTSAIMEGSLGAKEDVEVNPNLLDSYSLSMFKREVRLQEFLDHDENQERPKISLLRFGTVVGNSPGQRTDLMIPSFFRAAYTTGRLEVGGHNKMRSFLTSHDLSNAIHTLISKMNQAHGPHWVLATTFPRTSKRK